MFYLDERNAEDKLEEKIMKSCPYRASIDQLNRCEKDIENLRKRLQEKSSAETIER